MKKTFVGPVLLLFLATSAMFAADTVVEEIIARINDQIITRSELQRSREQLITEMRQQFGQQADARASEREKDMLRDLIDQQLLLEKGKDLGITGDTELVKRLDEMRKQMSLSSMEDLEKAAQQQGVSYEEFKNNLRNNIITQAVISREVGSHVQVSAEETKKFYEEHRSEFEVPEQVRLSEILVAIPAAKPDNPQEDEQHRVAFAEAKAQELLALIRSGAQFENVARSNSSGPSAAQGGDLGFFKRGTLAKELEEKTFAMKPGEVSDVIRTKQGFVILKVTEHPQAGLPPMKDVEPRIQEAIYLQKLQPTLRTYLTKLREEAFIDIKPGYADTGASPNQTKPVISVAADEGGKNSGKPKKKKKLLVF